MNPLPFALTSVFFAKVRIAAAAEMRAAFRVSGART
jgi:hypothetical protein